MAADLAPRGKPHRIVQRRKLPENGEGPKLEEWKVYGRLMCHGTAARMQPASPIGRTANQIAMRRERGATSTATRRPARTIPVSLIKRGSRSRGVGQSKRGSLSKRAGKT